MNTVKVSLVSKIVSVLKLDDEGKVANFFKREAKRFASAIKALEQNIKSIEFTYESSKAELEEKIEDATGYINDAYEAVKLEDLKNNDSMESFSDAYWKNIARKEATLESLQKSLTELTEAFEKDVKVVTDQIAKYQARIDKIS